jgi:hypothetical protein
MRTINERQSGGRASASIMAVATVQFIGSIALLVPAGLFLFEELQLRHSNPSTYRALHPAVYVVYIVLPIGFAVVGIMASMGLWFLREWARQGTLFLATVPAAVYTELVILRPSALFPRSVGGVYLNVVESALFLLVPVSTWWLILFTRPSVKARFQSQKTANSAML